jgi:hypothetical protein
MRFHLVGVPGIELAIEEGVDQNFGLGAGLVIPGVLAADADVNGASAGRTKTCSSLALLQACARK